eukprot:CAMPEP_0198350194 /NCGR_PEP_ID=MMETSP1450-20131203/97794_1 /TAXON_ID=753684 ORGANISM="Madagascaria erythrocladiodes, Strain CCMP3234" /NCGR_SAMPLE_ID=MMETSP1450 /ASSEMBLY_ACC=CAM_ASM_001115 /LENGTH=35 /DNA_ID= /DNA_START= /DNA_END= /DNA_ORIENTATION=
MAARLVVSSDELCAEAVAALRDAGCEVAFVDDGVA